jgi:hypothetical protein
MAQKKKFELDSNNDEPPPEPQQDQTEPKKEPPRSEPSREQRYAPVAAWDRHDP